MCSKKIKITLYSLLYKGYIWLLDPKKGAAQVKIKSPLFSHFLTSKKNGLFFFNARLKNLEPQAKVSK